MPPRYILKVDNVSNTYYETVGFKKVAKPVLESVSFDMLKGQIIGLVGESGSGKSTLAKCILGVIDYTGSITLDTKNPQMVFQDSTSSLNPSMTVERILEEPLIIRGGMTKGERMKKVEEILDIPDHLRAFAIFPLGYPTETKKQQDRFEEERIHYCR